ncbi:DUF7674 family protein [Tenggerimyces flavus]|uniref:DUF7674 domain-containing protein n=1 Tax=Tenggerimyces flavus TaxID=1708749 RepID=A0ABV7YDB7_9ACTN|nr:hypothetical protein [Tenggerimyces flavus]MBM7783621.1 hypothetical protein [Tenggerimyces flavus]
MSNQINALVTQLAEAVTRFPDMLAEHREQYGPQAPRAFLRTLAFVSAAGYQSGASDAAGEFQKVLDILDAEVGKDDAVDELIAVAFLANAPLDGDPRGSLQQLLGPKLRGLLDKVPAHDSTHGFVHRMVAAEPALAADLNEHVETYDDVLPHLFMGEIVDRLVEWIGSGEESALARAGTVLQALEDEWGKDYEIDETIAASFVENLPDEDSSDRKILSLLGPKLKKELDRQRA